MKLEQKHILLIVGGVVLLAAIGIGIYLVTRPGEEKDNDDEEKGGDDPDAGDEPEEKPAPDYNHTYPAGTIGPIYNEEKELDNSIGELKGVLLYPKRESAGGFGYANIRSSASVNTESAWYDPFDNLLTTINSGTPIGRVISEAAGVYNGYSYRWFKVKLVKAVGFWGTTTEGYVRGDTVTFIPFKK